MAWGDGPGVFYITLECPNGRWWQGAVLASNKVEAIETARADSGMPAAPMVLCDQVTTSIEPLVLNSAIVEPRGWRDTDGH